MRIASIFHGCLKQNKKFHLLNKGHLSFRAAPENLRAEDRYLFEHELQKQIPETHLVRLSHAVVIGNDIFTFPFTVYRKYTTVVGRPASLREKSQLLAKVALRTTRHVDKAVWITDDWSSNYFHWMTDALPRLEACADYINGHAVLLPMAYSKIWFVQELLALLQIPAIYYDPAFPLSVNETLVPSHTAPPGNYHKKFIHGLRSRLVVQDTNETSGNRIYISRRKAGKRGLTNEDEVQGILRQHGFKVHYMEDYCLLDQVEIMSEANMLVGLHGAGLTNMLFMPTRSKILEIRNYGDDRDNCYFTLASEFGHRYFYIQSQADNEDTHTANVTGDLGALDLVLRLMIKAQ